MLLDFWNHHGYAPSTSEIRSREKSLDALADALQGLKARDQGVALMDKATENPDVAVQGTFRAW
jgi:hypothetical protein